MKVGVLTGGGDCPGLNAVMRAVGRRVMARVGTIIGTTRTNPFKLDGGVQKVLANWWEMARAFFG